MNKTDWIFETAIVKDDTKETWLSYTDLHRDLRVALNKASEYLAVIIGRKLEGYHVEIERFTVEHPSLRTTIFSSAFWHTLG